MNFETGTLLAAAGIGIALVGALLAVISRLVKVEVVQDEHGRQHIKWESTFRKHDERLRNLEKCDTHEHGRHSIPFRQPPQDKSEDAG